MNPHSVTDDPCTFNPAYDVPARQSTQPIKVLTDYHEVSKIVNQAADAIRAGAHIDREDVAGLLECLADELRDEACVEVYNPNVPNEACRQYVTGLSARTDYGVCDSSDIWNEALRLARAALAPAVADAGQA